MGDGRFFSLSREFGCMGLLATQSVNVLQSTSLKENWRSVFSTFGAKIFMRLADNETAKEATELAGKSTWYVTSRGLSHGKEGLSGSEQRSIQQYETVSTEVITQTFERGDAVAIGSLDGNESSKLLHFFHVPDYDMKAGSMAETLARTSPAPAQAVKPAQATTPAAPAPARRDKPASPAAPVVRKAAFEDD
jgi:type IV secretory pathway TraG/TraD family ATPase VirD4